MLPCGPPLARRIERGESTCKDPLENVTIDMKCAAESEVAVVRIALGLFAFLVSLPGEE